MQARPNDATSWENLYRYLPYLRQSLSCCVCTNVLQIPMGPVTTICQHHVCRECRGGKMLLRPSCSWCKDSNQFIENTQLRIIVQCFKKLCDYLASSTILHNLVSINNGGTSTLVAIIQEGCAITDEYQVHSNSSIAFTMLPLASLTPRQPASLGRVKQEKDSPPSDNKHSDKICVTDDLQTPTSSSCKGEMKMAEVKYEKTEWNIMDATHSQGQTENSRADTPNLNPVSVHNGSLDDYEDHSSEVLSHHSQSTHSHQNYSSSEPASSTPNSPVYDHTACLSQTVAAEHDYNKDCGSAIYSVSMSNDNAPRLKIRRTDRYTQPHVTSTGADAEDVVPRGRPAQTESINQESDASSSGPALTTEKKSKAPYRSKSKPKPKPRGCRCGLATPTPGKLTCCGQRCPCYSAFKGCLPDCRCRGCRNPRKCDISDIPVTVTVEREDGTESDDSEIEVDV